MNQRIHSIRWQWFAVIFLISTSPVSLRAAETKESTIIKEVSFEDAANSANSAVPARPKDNSSAAGIAKRNAPLANAKTSFQPADFRSGSSNQLDEDALLKTVNDTLKESRDVRKNLSAAQEAYERMTIENNVLKNRLRSVEKRVSEKEDEKKELAQEMKRRQDQVDELRTKNNEQIKTMLQQNEKLNQSREQIASLETKLGEAILESERDAYKEKIKKTHAQAEEAVRELAKVNYQSMELQGELGESYYRMGNILFEQRQFDKAAEYYQKAIHFNPQLSYAHYNLGVIYDYYLNDNPSALEHYKKYLSMEPEDEASNRIQERIVELQLIKNVVPKMPLKLDFNEIHDKRN